jgi:hypothetical protein
VTFACAAFAAGAATAAGDSYGPWQPTYQGPIDVPAGFVCSFPISAEPVHQHLLLRYRYDAAGNIVGYQVTGPIVVRITNTLTGDTVQRNAASLATVTLNPDGSWTALFDGNLLLFMTVDDTPSGQLLLLSGRTVLSGTAAGTKSLVEQTGRSENLCDTLA